MKRGQFNPAALILLILGAAVAGCLILLLFFGPAVTHRSGRTIRTDMTSPDAASSRADFQGRLKAAGDISTVSKRDAAFAAIARDAADEGHPDVAQEAISAISVFSLRDQTTHEAAIGLARGNNAVAAVEVANKISSISLRDETLETIAKGDY